MIKSKVLQSLSGACVMAIAIASSQSASAQATQSADPGTQAQEANVARDDATIIVTARRRAEQLIDVPQTVNAVTGEDLQEFQILSFEDVSDVVSGLVLEGSGGLNPTAQARGVRFDLQAQGTPTVEMYVNEVPVQPQIVFQANFDIGQIEVLRGPQGTLRGRSAPTGAITNTTRRPDLREYGGYVSGVFTGLGGVNIQGALGIPIIRDVLGLRIAGLIDRNDAGGVLSPNNPAEPYSRTRAIRASLLFEPTPDISAMVVYQRLHAEHEAYGEVLFGPGASGLTNFPGFTRPATASQPAVFAPANFNGPPLSLDDRMNVQDFLGYDKSASHLVTGRLDIGLGGHTLSYVGGYAVNAAIAQGDGDANNTAVGVQRKVSRTSDSGSKRMTHEIRLSSDERLFNMLDYTIGAFYGKEKQSIFHENANQFVLRGAFGSPLGTSAPGGPGLLSPFTYDPRYAVGFFFHMPDQKEIEKALFANLTLHLGDSTELSGGVRQIWKDSSRSISPFSADGLAAVQNPNGLGPCPATVSGNTGLGLITNGTVVGSTYAGTCDVIVTLGNGAPPVEQIIRPIPVTKSSSAPLVYNVTLSHKITPDIMVYATHGTSFRQGPGPIIAAPLCAASVTPGAPDPAICDKYTLLDDEMSKSYELGLKMSLFGSRMTVAIAAYLQDYEGFFIRGASAASLLTGQCSDPTNTVLCRVTTGVFTYNADTRVKGIDAQVDLRVNEDLSFGVSASWAKGRFKNTLVPCRDSNFDGIPDSNPLPTTAVAWLAAGGPLGVTLCETNSSSSSPNSPPWNATIRGEYSLPINDTAKAFIRGLFNFYPRNTNSQISSTDFVPEAHGILNVFAGVRGMDRNWELTFGARNLLNNQTVLSRTTDQGSLIVPQSGLSFAPTTSNNSGYQSISFVRRREFSLGFRMTFGSR
jgi:iron complex outermembrane receptor protein